MHLTIPVKNGEGCWFAPAELTQELEQSGQIVLRYVGENPNGSVGAVAGVVDERVVQSPAQIWSLELHDRNQGAEDEATGLAVQIAAGNDVRRQPRDRLALIDQRADRLIGRAIALRLAHLKRAADQELLTEAA